MKHFHHFFLSFFFINEKLSGKFIQENAIRWERKRGKVEWKIVKTWTHCEGAAGAFMKWFNLLVLYSVESIFLELPSQKKLTTHYFYVRRNFLGILINKRKLLSFGEFIEKGKKKKASKAQDTKQEKWKMLRLSKMFDFFVLKIQIVILDWIIVKNQPKTFSWRNCQKNTKTF